MPKLSRLGKRFHAILSYFIMAQTRILRRRRGNFWRDGDLPVVDALHTQKRLDAEMIARGGMDKGAEVLAVFLVVNMGFAVIDYP